MTATAEIIRETAGRRMNAPGPAQEVRSPMREAGYRLVPIHGRGGVVARARVSPQDYDELSQFRWHFDSAGYARRNVWDGSKNGTVRMHRQVLGLGPGHIDKRQTDHINRDRTDNRRENLRVATNAENGQNLPARKGGTSRYRGVSWYQNNQKWVAKVHVGGRNYSLGCFDDEDEAGRAAADFRREHMPFSEEALNR